MKYIVIGIVSGILCFVPMFAFANGTVSVSASPAFGCPGQAVTLTITYSGMSPTATSYSIDGGDGVAGTGGAASGASGSVGGIVNYNKSGTFHVIGYVQDGGSDKTYNNNDVWVMIYSTQTTVINSWIQGGVIK